MKSLERHQMLERQLRQMLAEYEQRAAAIRTTLDLLVNAQASTNGASSGSGTAAALLDQARAIDATRRASRNGATPRKHAGGRPPRGHRLQDDPDYHSRAAVTARRARTRRFLATLDPVTPRPAKFQGIGPLMLYGYIAKKGDGYIRTSKPFPEN